MYWIETGKNERKQMVYSPFTELEKDIIIQYCKLRKIKIDFSIIPITHLPAYEKN